MVPRRYPDVLFSITYERLMLRGSPGIRLFPSLSATLSATLSRLHRAFLKMGTREAQMAYRFANSLQKTMHESDDSAIHKWLHRVIEADSWTPIEPNEDPADLPSHFTCILVPAKYNRAGSNDVVLALRNRRHVVGRCAGEEVPGFARRATQRQARTSTPARNRKRNGELARGGILASIEERRALFVVPVPASDCEIGRYSGSRQYLKANPRCYIKARDIAGCGSDCRRDVAKRIRHKVDLAVKSNLLTVDDLLRVIDLQGDAGSKTQVRGIT
jgi:hypothetical protein